MHAETDWIKKGVPAALLALAIAGSVLLNLSALSVQTTGGSPGTVTNPLSQSSFLFQQYYTSSPLNPVNIYRYAAGIGGKVGAALPSCSQSSALPGYTRFSPGLIAALGYLEQHTPQSSIFVFGYYQNIREHPVCDWGSNSFVRTALSGRQTVVEGDWQKGLIAEPGLEQRIADDLRFYRAIVEPQTYDSAAWQEFNDTAPSIGKFSYDQYFSLYRKDDPLYAKSNLKSELLSAYPSIISEDWTNESKAAAFASSFLQEYNVSYVLFEGGEKPRADVAAQLGMKQVFEQGDSVVYQVGS